MSLEKKAGQTKFTGQKCVFCISLQLILCYNKYVVSYSSRACDTHLHVVSVIVIQLKMISFIETSSIKFYEDLFNHSQVV